MGPQMSDDQPMASKTPALVALSTCGVVCSVAAISGVAMSSDVLVDVMTSVFQLTMNRIRYRCHVRSFDDWSSAVATSGSALLIFMSASSLPSV
jgi:hypothetical protein